MTYRIETRRCGEETLIVFSGLLDDAALADVAGRLAASASSQLVLAKGAEVTHAAMVRLRELPVAIRAESPFLAAWLRSPADPRG